MDTIHTTNRLHTELEAQFKAELVRIGKHHYSRQAKFAQSVLAYIQSMHLTVPKIAGQCQKLLHDANPYTGEYWTLDARGCYHSNHPKSSKKPTKMGLH